MRIGIDGRTILNPEKGEAAGVGHYTYQLIRHLLKIDQKNQFVLFFDWRAREKDVLKFKAPNAEIKYFPFSYYRSYLPGMYSEIITTAFLNKARLDIFHSAGGAVPLSYKRPIVLTAHNLALYKHPEFAPYGYRIKAALWGLPQFKKADAIIATSGSAKKDIEELFKINEKRIKVVYNGLDARFFNKAPIEEIRRIKEKYGIGIHKYLLFLSTIKPVNNLPRLALFFREVHNRLNKKDAPAHYHLIIAGKDGWLAPYIKREIRDFGLDHYVRFPGYIPPEDLNALFQGAEAFVFPPLYEEFGTPILEAMASGVPVIASNAASLPEVAGGAAIMLDPVDKKAWAEKIIEVLSDEKLRQDLIAKGLARAKEFSWEKTATETLKVYEKVNKIDK